MLNLKTLTAYYIQFILFFWYFEKSTFANSITDLLKHANITTSIPGLTDLSDNNSIFDFDDDVISGLTGTSTASSAAAAVIKAGAKAANLVRAKYLDLLQNPGELCYRNCETGQKPKACYFVFVLENYHAMGPACKRCAEGVINDCFHPHCITADGIEKGVMSINRKIPGPAIHVCKNDLVVVDVVNKMVGSSASIHWHGLHQRETPWMDGVPLLTQCPIEYGTTFRYAFWASEAGTQYYHSHSGHQKVNGHYGALIVRQPQADDPNFLLYDVDAKEHTIILSDWMHSTAEMVVPGLPFRARIAPSSVLINGKGRTFNREIKKFTKTPLEIFNVEPNRRYRFRLINSGSHACNFRFQIENHTLLVIASDSYNVHPIKADTLFSTSGERYDFIVVTNKPIGDYWIRLRAGGNCVGRHLEQFAILRYVSKEPPKSPPVLRPIPTYEQEFPSTWQLNHPNASCYHEKDQCVTKLKSHESDFDLRQASPNYRFYLGFDNYVIPNKILFDPTQPLFSHFMNTFANITLVGAVNGLSLEFPSFPPLTQPEQIVENQFCDQNIRPIRCKDKKICSCIHRIKIQLNSVVELVIVDETEEIRGVNHPFHLHGYRFMVTEVGQHPMGLPMTVEMVKKMDIANRLRVPAFTIPYSLNPPFKDTVSIPSRGFSIVRFRADNPGFWLMHCHFEWHLATGMGVIFQVGEVRNMRKPPKGFPKCGNFEPNIRESVITGK